MKTSHFRLLWSILLTVVLSVNLCPAWGQVKAWEGTITIPTYGWEDDVNPKFWSMEAGAKGSTTVKASIIYPYTMQDHLGRKLQDVTYKAIFLENEYIRITCLPELGGRLHSVLDKTTNEEMFHKNSVIKPGMIAMRGAFISGGVEWNAGPQVHTVTILSPVNALAGQNKDGSAFIEVSNLEKSLRTGWTVRITLHPGKSYLEEDIRMFNPTDAMNPYYFWNCTAFPQLPGTRFIYPMKLGTDHYGVRFFDWPVNKGRDISWTKNYEDAASIFAVNAAFDFFGAYDAGLDRGIVQVANRHEHNGKKAWTWGQGEYGRVSQLSLTDTDGNYIEVQSGPLQTQSDYGIFAPGSSIRWKEYWYPVHGLGDGFEYANEKLAFQTKFIQNNMEIRIIGTENIPGAKCKVMDGDVLIDTRMMDISPLTPTKLMVNTGNLKQVDIIIESPGGQVIADFKAPLQIPDITTPVPPSYSRKALDSLSIEEIYLRAQKFDRSLDRINARKYYELALMKDPLHMGSLRDLAILDYESGLYDKAAEGFKKALNQVPNDDGLSWYFLGLCYLNKEDQENAIRCGFKASRCLGTVSSGYSLVGRAKMILKKYNEAGDYFLKAWNADRYDPRAFHLCLIAFYANNDLEKAQKLSAQRIIEYPTELIPRIIYALAEKKLDSELASIRDFTGEDDFELIEAAVLFANSGLTEEAIRILEAGCINGIDPGKQNHIIHYLLGYWYSKTGNNEKAGLYLKQVPDRYQDYLFASRPEEEAALRYAIRINPDDPYAYYHLGNILGNFGRLKEAAEYWEKAVGINPGLSIPWRNLGLYYWVEMNDHKRSESCYRNAIKARPTDQTLYRDLAQVLVDAGRRSDAINLLEKMQFQGTQRSDVIIDLAQYYLEEERYDESIKLLTSQPYFVNWEGSTITWDLFNKALVGKGIVLFNKKDYKGALRAFETALTFPDNLGVGESDRTAMAKALFWKGKTLISMGKTAEALNAWIKGSKLSGERGEQGEYVRLCRSLIN